MSHTYTHKRGFTLVELLVVIAIIGVLIALLLPAVQAARESGRRISCTNNLKQIGLSLHVYHDSHLTFPPGWIGDPTTHTGPGWCWAALALPFMEQEPLHDSIDFGIPITDPANAAARTTDISAFHCPSAAGDELVELASTTVSTTDYAGCFGTSELEEADIAAANGISDGVFQCNEGVKISQITDGTSGTIMAGERNAEHDLSTWTGFISGADEPYARFLGHAHAAPNTGHHLEDFNSYHPAGANFLFGDGSVKIITSEIEVDLFEGLATRASGEITNGY